MCNCNCNGITIPVGPTGPTGPTGATGATGAAGADGSDGTSVLYNSTTPATSTGSGSYDILQTYTIPANTLVNDGDELWVHTYFTTTNPKLNNAVQAATLKFNNVVLDGSFLNLGQSFYPSNCYKVTIDTRIIRVSNTSVKYESSVKIFSPRYFLLVIMGYDFIASVDNIIGTINGLDLTANPYIITSEGKSSTIGTDDVNCPLLEVIYGAI